MNLENKLFRKLDNEKPIIIRVGRILLPVLYSFVCFCFCMPPNPDTITYLSSCLG